MHSRINMIIAVVLYLNIVPLLCEDSGISGKEAEEYDIKLSEFIKEIIENFRDQMPEGISAIGVPPLDPLVIPSIDEDIDENIAKMTLRMRHLNIIGISKFQIKSLKADLERGFANFSIAIPELVSDGYCYMNGKILKIFPIRGDGPFFIRVTEVSLDGHGKLTVITNGDTKVHMNDLKLHLTFGPLEVEFKSLLGGGRWSEILVKLLTGLAPNLFMHFREEAMTVINKALLTLINKELDKGTLKDLLDMIPSPLKK